jgi:DNA topoisomerase-2
LTVSRKTTWSIKEDIKICFILLHDKKLKKVNHKSNNTMTEGAKTLEEKYQKKDLREHILTRPDSYIGSIKSITDEVFVVNDTKDGMTKEVLTYVPGLYKIFDEILVNAMDHSVNDTTVTHIKVLVDKENNEISIMNNGTGIIIEKHKEYGIYIPELIFGNLLTSTNYDDTEDRVTGGRNGLGAKLTSVFSTEFTVETIDSVNKKKYIQTFKDNMTVKGIPKITTVSTAKSYTKITFKPDLKRFGMNKLEEDIVKLFEKRTYDCAACTRKDVNVYFNGLMMKYKFFEKYVDLYIGNKLESKRVYQEGKNNEWELACSMSSSDKSQQVSFVNSLWTINGGRHVDYIQNQIVRKLTEVIQNKNKNITVKPSYIKDRLFIFLKSTIVNPTFSSQTKEELTTNIKDFGFRFDVSDEFILKLSKCGIIEEIIAFSRHKESREMSKTDGKKKSTVKIEKLDDANWAGTSKSAQCTLILTEGDSAKAFAISGLSVVGRDTYGVYPLRGKMLNVRDASTKKIMENKEVSDLKTILGLKENKVYTDINELRYGKIMILTDSDYDGYHIKGLIMNMIHSGWSSLLKIPEFIIAMKTPIVKVKKGKIQHEFYTLKDYNEWKETHTSGWTIKYYKGLGTSSAKEAKEYFNDMDKTIVKYKWDKNIDKSIKLAFEKKQADNRKTWIGNFNPNEDNLEMITKEVEYTDFINKELIHFSVSDLQRSIPSICDGLKPSQRKVLFYMLKNNVIKEMKVSQLSGYISAETSYHHGPTSMEGTIVNLAQDYVGSNNINLLEPSGQFGTRLASGKDSASPRYINTSLAAITRSLFPKEDNDILNYLEDDGISIEPEWFLPIIPMVLVNGVEGIGTGFSTSIPRYNPKDIIRNIEKLINEEEMLEIHPYYKNHTGLIEKNGDSGYISKGTFKKVGENILEIIELPVGKAINDYKEFLESDPVELLIKGYTNHSTEDSVRFVLDFKSKDTLSKLIESGDIYKELKLTKSFSISNMHLFNSQGKIQKYSNVNEIIQEFFNVRMEYYDKRKEHLTKHYKELSDIADSKMRFIMAIIDDRLKVFKQKKKDIEMNLERLQFMKIKDSYNYLTDLSIHSFTEEKIEELKKYNRELKNKLEFLDENEADDLWMYDLEDYIKISKKVN